MSAYVISNEQMEIIASAVWYSKDPHYTSHFPNMRYIKDFGELTISGKEHMQTVARRIHDMNCNAVNQRYSHFSESETSAFIWQESHIKTIFEVYKAIECLLYQCSEGNVPQLNLFKALDNYRNAIARKIATNTSDYKAAKTW